MMSMLWHMKRGPELSVDTKIAGTENPMLRAALDEVRCGIVLLDRELRAQFINRAFRRMWRLPDAKADSKPAFVALMYHGRDTRAYQVPPDRLDAYVAERVAHVRSGNPAPIDLPLASGEVIRFHCTMLPDGSRMLSYTYVTDLAHPSSEPSRLAMTDELTGLFNRRHFFARADAEWQRFQRYQRPLSLLMIDIDHFKSINDRFGHQIGDRTIQQVAETCRAERRSADIVARIGGDEFVALLPETDSAQAGALAERLRQGVAKRAVPVDGIEAALSVSIGLAGATLSMSGIDALIKVADDALSQAKAAGRNRVVGPVASAPVPYDIAAE
jgi:diguanylate cyclase (GGDEF)-like protein